MLIFADVTSRKRRSTDDKKKNNQDTHPLRPPCECRRGCISKITQLRRIQIWLEFWNLKYDDRKQMIHQLVHSAKKKTVTSQTSSRQQTLTYHHINDSGEHMQVCKKFFLATIGYGPKSSVVDETKGSCSETSPLATKDKRGKHAPKHKLQPAIANDIDAHIESYEPAISHYRRMHAPHRRYLPTNLTVREMYENFKDNHTAYELSYVTYLRRVEAKNISFAKLGLEECEKCMEFSLMHSHEETAADCDVCIAKDSHVQHAAQARAEYKKDGAEVKAGVVVRSADMQKVMMLPRIPGCKSVCFTQRLTTYHETFAPVGQYMTTNVVPTESFIWHDAEFGRKASDVAAVFTHALMKDRDYDTIVYYLDNCSGQNKNWTLFSTMVKLINTDHMVASRITFKYFEPGHTFMSADSIHAKLERSMAKTKVFDFNDLKSCYNIPNVQATELKYSDVKQFRSHLSAAKRKEEGTLLADLKVVEFRKGDRKLYYKTSHAQQAFRPFEFLAVRFRLQYDDPPLPAPQGFEKARKDTLLNNLGQLMPANRLSFWQNISEK